MRYESHNLKRDLTIRNFNAITELLLINVVGDYSSETTKININFIVPKKGDLESIDETYHGRKRVHKMRASKIKILSHSSHHNHRRIADWH